MTTSLSARHHEDNPAEARLRGLSRQQLADRLNWLSWYQPGIFTALMDYLEFSEDLAADTDPTNPGPHFDELDDGEEAVLVPGSAACSHVM
jgi:hypothetical protein